MSMQTGMLYALIAYLIWGLLPLYLHALKVVAPLEILMHRMAWSLVFLAMLLLARRQCDLPLLVVPTVM